MQPPIKTKFPRLLMTKYSHMSEFWLPEHEYQWWCQIPGSVHLEERPFSSSFVLPASYLWMQWWTVLDHRSGGLTLVTEELQDRRLQSQYPRLDSLWKNFFKLLLFWFILGLLFFFFFFFLTTAELILTKIAFNCKLVMNSQSLLWRSITHWQVLSMTVIWWISDSE